MILPYFVIINLKGENIRSQEDLKKALEKYLLPPVSQASHAIESYGRAQQYVGAMA